MRWAKAEEVLFSGVEVGYLFRWSIYTIAMTRMMMIATAPNTPPAIAPTFTELDLLASVELAAGGVAVEEVAAVWTSK